MPSGNPMRSEDVHINPRRSMSSVPLQLNLPVDLARTLRTWAEAVNGRCSVIAAQLITAEIVRRQEREKLRRFLDGDK